MYDRNAILFLADENERLKLTVSNQYADNCEIKSLLVEQEEINENIAHQLYNQEKANRDMNLRLNKIIQKTDICNKLKQ